MSESAPDASLPSVARADVERLVGVPVDDLALFEEALRHRSLLREHQDLDLASNERLEFLGDALLGFVVAEHLYARFPERDEGYLTRLRAKLVSGQACARYGQRLGLGPHLLMSANMEQGRGRENKTILADAFEALIGALYLDQGMEAARAFVYRSVLDEVDLSQLARRQENYKSALLEFAQARGWPQPTYEVVHEEGPSHDKRFTVEVYLHGRPAGRGTAASKKAAEQLAARRALDDLRDEDES